MLRKELLRDGRRGWRHWMRCGLCDRYISVVVLKEACYVEDGVQIVGHSCGSPACEEQERILLDVVEEHTEAGMAGRLRAHCQKMQRRAKEARRQRLFEREKAA